MKNVFRALGLALLLVPASSLAQTATAARALRPGDALHIQVWRQPELTGEFMITQQGTIEHPLYRSLVVAGLSFEEVEARLADLLGRYETEPKFVIQPLLTVSVGGEVRQPSLYRLPPTTTIAEAIAIAGGATERGDLDEVRLFRGGREIAVDLTKPEAGLAQQPIQSGDQVYVEREISIWRDYIAPAGSVLAALATIANIIISNQQ